MISWGKQLVMRVCVVTVLAVGLLAQGAGVSSDRAQILISQIGFATNGPKIAVMPHESNRPLDWSLREGSGRLVMSGQTQVYGPDESSGQTIHRIDLSTVGGQADGLRLSVGRQRSRLFAISDRPYAGLVSDAFAYFYHNRSGVPIEEALVGRPEWARPAGHAPDIVTCFEGADSKGNRWPGCSYSLDVTGGWYDAGDHGKYVNGAAMTVWTMLHAYERQLHAREGGSVAFQDGWGRIPEAGNGVNDLIDEVRFEMEMLLNFQIPEGESLVIPTGNQLKRTDQLAFTEIDASGLVHEKVHGDRWTPLPTRPDQDPTKRSLYPPSTQTTLNLAAIGAQCARVWRSIDEAFATRCLEAAERAFEAARRHPDLKSYKVFPGGGGAIQSPIEEDLFWAASELFITTGRQRYLQVMERSSKVLNPKAEGSERAGISEVVWPPYKPFALMSLATVPSDLPAEKSTRVRDVLMRKADFLLQAQQDQGYFFPYEPKITWWGSNYMVLLRAIVLGTAYDITGDRRYRDAVVHALDYILGRNPLDQSYVSGYGARPLQTVHHRFWARGYDERAPGPPPGALSGGPNSVMAGEKAAEGAAEDCAPLACWSDNPQAYAFNEVAIYWNAALFWVAAFLDDEV